MALSQVVAIGLLGFAASACNRVDILDSASDIQGPIADRGVIKADIGAAQGAEKKAQSKSYALAAGTVDSSSQRPVATNTDLIHEAFKPNSSHYRSTEQIAGHLSADCRRILAEAGIESARLRSPTVSAEINNEGDVGIGASYDFVDWKRASLQEELAVARCARHAAGIKLSQLTITSTQALSRSGYLATARSLAASRSRFRRIETAIKNGLYNGNLTVLNAAILRQNLRQVQAQEARSQGEAAKREVADRILKKRYGELDVLLVESERRIHDIESRIRTSNAVKLRGIVSYGRTSDTDATLNRSAIGGREDVTGKVQLAVRLGAFSSRRRELEEVARSARVESYYEPDSGAIWRTQELARANARGLASLRRQKKDVERALAEAQNNARRAPSDFEPELLAAQLRAKIDVEAFKAQLAGLNATILDTRRVNDRLRFRR